MGGLTHKKGRKAKRYPGSVHELRQVVEYDPGSGMMCTTTPRSAGPTRSKDGHMYLKVPYLGENDVLERDYFRVDYLAWYMSTGDWPTGWMEHVNGLKTDCSLDNLVHCDEFGARWWYGVTDGTVGARELVMVDGEGLLLDGPVTLRVTGENNEVKVIPRPNAAWMTQLRAGKIAEPDD